jgi:hypothetical protein
MQRFILLAAVVLTGCGLFTGGDDQHTCPDVNDPAIAEPELRDPQTGICDLSQPIDPECSPDCPCAAQSNTAGDAEPAIIGGECDGPCEGLDEQDCISNGACHAAYTDAGMGAAQYWSCFDIAPQEPQTQSQPCNSLDVYDCFFDPQCGSLYSGDAQSGTTEFESCIDVGSDACNCGSGESCVTECPACNGSSACSCTQVCMPTQPDCTLQCQQGETCQLQCEGQGCTPECTLDPGQCSGTITCNIAAPQCPQGTTPGIEDGCFTGYCIPDSDCAPADCATLTDEASCTARSDCDAVYTGSNCTCDDSGCTCTTLTFERCQDLGSGGSGNGSGI